MQDNSCTVYEAAALWELNRCGNKDYSGWILVLDLDSAGAGLCRCQTGTLPKEVWQSAGSLTGSFLREAVQAYMPNSSDPEQAAGLLYDSLSYPSWVRYQRNYLSGNRATDVILPALVQDGQSYVFSCAGLDNLFSANRRDAIGQMLRDAITELDNHEGAEDCLLLPVGQLARLFLAEYMIREVFLDPNMPLLPDDRLRTCSDQEDPGRIKEMGLQLYQEATYKPQALNATLRLQLLRRQGETLSPELLTLAKAATPLEQLEIIRFGGPICVSRQSGLSLFADTSPLPVTIPDRLFTPEQPLLCVDVGVGLDKDKPVLALRLPNGTIEKIGLDIT